MEKYFYKFIFSLLVTYDSKLLRTNLKNIVYIVIFLYSYGQKAYIKCNIYIRKFLLSIELN